LPRDAGEFSDFGVSISAFSSRRPVTWLVFCAGRAEKKAPIPEITARKAAGGRELDANDRRISFFPPFRPAAETVPLAPVSAAGRNNRDKKVCVA